MKKLILFLCLLTLPSIASASYKGNPHFFSIIPSFEDRATQWNGFRPGRGYGNPIKADWNWQLQIPEGKSLTKITIINPRYMEAWSTDSKNIFGKQPYPLVIFKDGKQVNLDYAADLSGLEGKIFLHGQIETQSLTDAEAIITYTDGSTTTTPSEDYTYYGEYETRPERRWVAIDKPNFYSIHTGDRIEITFRKSADQPIDIELWETSESKYGLTFKKISTVVENYSSSTPYVWFMKPEKPRGTTYRLYIKYNSESEVVGDLTDDNIAIY